MIREITLALLVTSGVACGQSVAVPAKGRAFEVVSIRPSAPSIRSSYNPTTSPDGYNVNGQATFMTLMFAFYPQGRGYWSRERIAGGPTWLFDPYDIHAKVSDADLAEWQKQGVTLDKEPLLREMLQTMLADRFHLVAHMLPGPPIQGWSLEMGKRASVLKESKPDQEKPAGMLLHDGGVMAPYQPGETPRMAFYGATMADLAQALTMYAGRPVEDHTGLTGHYNFVVYWAYDPDSRVPPGYTSSDDPDPLSHWNIEAIGIKSTPVKIPVDTLVIDHIEKPSEN